MRLGNQVDDVFHFPGKKMIYFLDSWLNYRNIAIYL